jgi:hypothetical protein
MKTIAFALLSVALAAPALAADGQQAASPKPKPHLICKRDQDTATRMSKRTCKTAAEWAGTSVDDDQAAVDTLSRQQTTLDGGPLMGPGGRAGPSPQ